MLPRWILSVYLLLTSAGVFAQTPTQTSIPFPASTAEEVCGDYFEIAGGLASITDPNDQTAVRRELGDAAATALGGQHVSPASDSGAVIWNVLINAHTAAMTSDGGMYVGVSNDATGAMVNQSLVSDGSTDGASGFVYILFSGSRNGPDGTPVVYGEPYAVGDLISVELHLDDLELRFYKNGVDQGVAHTQADGLARDATYRLAVGFTSIGNVSIVPESADCTFFPETQPPLGAASVTQASLCAVWSGVLVASCARSFVVPR